MLSSTIRRLPDSVSSLCMLRSLRRVLSGQDGNAEKRVDSLLRENSTYTDNAYNSISNRNSLFAQANKVHSSRKPLYAMHFVDVCVNSYRTRENRIESIL